MSFKIKKIDPQFKDDTKKIKMPEDVNIDTFLPKACRTTRSLRLIIRQKFLPNKIATIIILHTMKLTSSTARMKFLGIVINHL